MRQLYITTIVLLISLNSIAQTNENNVIQEAQNKYDEILQALEYNRAARITLENQLEKNRIALRQAKNSASIENQEQFTSNLSNYEVLQNVIFEPMSQGTNSGYSVFIPKHQTGTLGKILNKDISNEFKDYMKNYSVGKIKKKKGEIFFDNIVIPEINSMPLDLYTIVVKEADGVTLKSFFYNGTSFIDFTEENNATANAKNILVHFAKATHKLHLEEEIKQKEKELKRIENDLENHQKKISHAREEILENEAEIVEAIQEISNAEFKIDTLKEDILLTRSKIGKIDLN